MIFLYTLTTYVIIIYFSGLVAPADVTGPLNGNVTLPCRYFGSTTTMCWGRGLCPSSQCNDEIIWTDGTEVTRRKSDRYQLLGNIGYGDASLTIIGATKEDEGTYCCRGKIYGFGFNLKRDVTVKIQEGVTTAGENVTGFVNDTVTLPCTYSAMPEATEVCWRKADCSKSTCSTSSILRTNGSSVIKRNSVRYKLLGNITQGDASLTITRLIMRDIGTYCCKVLIPGPAKYTKREVNVQVFETPVVIGSLDDTVMLPCTYSATEGLSQLCWGRGDCSNLRLCSDSILRTNGSSVIKRTSNRYALLGVFVQGNASLTITNLTMEDEGLYCCKVIIPGPANDVSKEITLQVLTGGERLNWNTLGNVIRGVIIFLVPIVVLLIYKCGSL